MIWVFLQAEGGSCLPSGQARAGAVALGQVQAHQHRCHTRVVGKPFPLRQWLTCLCLLRAGPLLWAVSPRPALLDLQVPPLRGNDTIDSQPGLVALESYARGPLPATGKRRWTPAPSGALSGFHPTVGLGAKIRLPLFLTNWAEAGLLGAVRGMGTRGPWRGWQQTVLMRVPVVC